MKFRNTLILLVIAVLLGAYVLLVERKTDPQEEEPFAIATPLAAVMTFAPSDARSVVVARPNLGQRTELTYGAEGLWRLAAPLQDEADQDQVIRFVEALSQLRPSRVLTETTGQPADYDLEPPLIQVDVTMQDGATHTLRLGAMNPSQSGYYGQVVGDSTVYLMPFSIGADAERMLNTPPVKPTPTPEAQATQPPLIPPPPTSQP